MSIFHLQRRVLLLAAIACTLPTQAQMLSHPGWVGTGISAEVWWKNAVFYQIDPLSFQDSNGDGRGDFNGIAMRLDYLQALGVDGIVLSPLQPRQNEKPAAGAPNQGPPLFDSAYGSEEDFDTLVQQASGRKIRLLVDLPLSGSQPIDALLGVARFWLSRGVAGLRLVRDPNDLIEGKPALNPVQVGDRVRELRKIAGGYAGQRVLLDDIGADASPDGASPQPQSQPQLQIEPHIAGLAAMRAAELRDALAAVAQPARTSVGPVPVFASDADGRQRSFDRLGDGKHDMAIAEIVATVLLTSHAATQLYYGQEIGMTTTPTANGSGGDPTTMQWGVPPFTTGTPWLPLAANAAKVNVQAEEADARSLLRWYRRLIALHHGNPTLRDGATTVLQTANPEVVAWARRAARPEIPAVVIVCNLSDHPVKLSLTAEIKAAQMHGTYFHTLLRSGIDRLIAGPASVESMSLPAYGVYIGELHR